MPIEATIALYVGIVVVAFVVTWLFFTFINKRHKDTTKLNNVKIGMSEQTVHDLLGAPRKTIDVDATTKVLTYVDKKYSFLWLVATEVEAQISIKDGVVTNVQIS